MLNPSTVFGKLTVIAHHDTVESEYSGRVFRTKRYRCKCECGNETIAREPDLKAGRTKSCGRRCKFATSWLHKSKKP